MPPPGSSQLGPVNLRYTNWVDIYSRAITQHTKIRSVNSAGRSGLLVRVFGNTLSDELVYTSTLLQNLSFAFRPNTVLNNIDNQIYDSWGELLYLPDYLMNTLLFQMTLQIEL